MENETVYVVRDAGGDYVSDYGGLTRTPAADEAFEFVDRRSAQHACRRSTDRVLVRVVDPDEIQ